MNHRFQAYRNHESDAWSVIDFLSRISRHPGYVADYTVGDFVWQGFRGIEIGFDERLGLWRDDADNLIGLCWLTPPNETSFTVDPQLYGTPTERQLIFEMMDWSLLRLPDLRGDTNDPIGVTLPTPHLHQAEILTELGLVNSGESLFNSYGRSLNDPIPIPLLPDGFKFEEMNDRANIAERIEIHREVWKSTKFTEEGYRLLRQAPIYRTDLDLAVTAPDGRFASYLIAWFDSGANTVSLEPVGARPEFRKLGLTQSLIQEALRRAQALGASRAYVLSYHTHVPANALYRSSGFEPLFKLRWWHYPEPAPKE